MKLKIRGVVRFASDIKLQNVTIGEEEKKVINTSIVANSSKDKATFMPCEIWNGNAEFVEKYFTKGSQVEIEGYLENRTRTHLKGTENEFNTTEVIVVAERFGFVGDKPKEE